MNDTLPLVAPSREIYRLQCAKCDNVIEVGATVFHCPKCGVLSELHWGVRALVIQDGSRKAA